MHTMSTYSYNHRFWIWTNSRTANELSRDIALVHCLEVCFAKSYDLERPWKTLKDLERPWKTLKDLTVSTRWKCRTEQPLCLRLHQTRFGPKRILCEEIMPRLSGKKSRCNRPKIFCFLSERKHAEISSDLHDFFKEIQLDFKTCILFESWSIESNFMVFRDWALLSLVIAIN